MLFTAPGVKQTNKRNITVQEKLIEHEFEGLVQREKATVYSVCLMFAADKQEADDIAQETLINLWRGFPSFRKESGEHTWVYRVTLNTCISFDRKRRRKRALHEEIELDPTILSPDTDLGRNTRRLHGRIQRLDPFDRAIVLLWLENMPYDEIGAIVGVSAKAVGMRLVRIREKLKTMDD